MRARCKIFCAFAMFAMCLVANSLHVTAREGQAKDDAQIKRGAYLVNNVARCGDCHTPRNEKGELDESRHLEGAPVWFTSNIKFKKWDKKSPDITASGKATSWSEEKMVTFFSTGQKANMPMPAYNMTIEDAKAVTAYLRSLPGQKK